MEIKKVRLSFLSMFLFLLLISNTFADNVNVDVSVPGTQFSKGVRGQSMRSIGVHRGEYIIGHSMDLEIIDDSSFRGVSTGDFAETYDWRTRWDATARMNGFGPPAIEYLRYARDTNATPIFTVNVQGLAEPTNTPGCETILEYYDTSIPSLADMAAEYVYYCNHLARDHRLGEDPNLFADFPKSKNILDSLQWSTVGDPDDQWDVLLDPSEGQTPPVMYWEIGNEVKFGGTIACGAWDLSTAEYHARYSGITSAMLTEDASIKVGPCITNVAWQDPQDSHLDIILDDPALPADFVSYHCYQNLGDVEDSEPVEVFESFLRDIYSVQEVYTTDVVYAIIDSGRSLNDVELLITEWNPSGFLAVNTPKVGRMAHALAIVETVFTYARLGVTAATYWDWPADTRDATPYPGYTAFQLLNDHMGNELVSYYSDGNNFRMYVTKDLSTGVVSVWGLNFDNDQDKAMSVALQGFSTPMKSVWSYKIGAANGGATTLLMGNVASPDNIPPVISKIDISLFETNRFDLDPTNFSYNFKAATINVIVFEPFELPTGTPAPAGLIFGADFDYSSPRLNVSKVLGVRSPLGQKGINVGNSQNGLYVEGKWGYGLEMYDYTSYIKWPLPPAFDPNIGAVEFWVKLDSTYSNSSRNFKLVDFGGENYIYWFQDVASADHRKVKFVSDSQAGSATIISGLAYDLDDGNWHHITVTWHSDPESWEGIRGKRLYIDGQVEGTNTSNQYKFEPSYISLGEDSISANAIFDEVHIYAGETWFPYPDSYGMGFNDRVILPVSCERIYEDTNDDSIVNLKDFADLANSWLSNTYPNDI